MLLYIIIFILSIAIGFFINAGVVWLLCWGLKAIGITTIFGWTVSFSWPLVVLFTLITMIISGFFHKAAK